VYDYYEKMTPLIAINLLIATCCYHVWLNWTKKGLAQYEKKPLLSILNEHNLFAYSRRIIFCNKTEFASREIMQARQKPLKYGLLLPHYSMLGLSLPLNIAYGKLVTGKELYSFLSISHELRETPSKYGGYTVSDYLTSEAPQ